MPRTPPPPWWSRATELKDSMTLTDLAAALGVQVSVLAREFRDRGVSKRILVPADRPARHAEPRTAKTPAPAPAPEAAVRAGSKDAHLEAHLHVLGKVPDADVARLAKVSIRTVASYRARHGIPGYDGPRKRPPAREGRGSRVDDFHALLGIVPDRVVSDLAGMSLGAIRNFRIKAGVEAAGRMTPAEIDAAVRAWRGEAPAVPEVPAARPASRQAWRITGADDAWIVLAPTLAAALRAASAVLGSDAAIQRIEALGPVLADA